MGNHHEWVFYIGVYENIMPVQRCVLNGKMGYKWGESGKCYTYETGNEQQREEAERKAIQQGQAIKVKKNGEKT